MKWFCIAAIAVTGCAHRDEVLGEFPHFDSAWWFGENRCPDGATRSVERYEQGAYWRCVLSDGTRHGPFVYALDYRGPIWAGFYERGVETPVYFDAELVSDRASAVGHDGRQREYKSGVIDFVAEHSLGCPDGPLEQYDEDGELVFRSMYDDGFEVGPRVPHHRGKEMPVICIIGALCPDGVDRWTYGAAKKDYCRDFRSERYHRRLAQRIVADPPLPCVAPTAEVKSAYGTIYAMESAASAFVIREGRLPSKDEASELMKLRDRPDSRHSDPWGRAFIYAAHSQERFRSSGPDGLPNTSDDVTLLTEIYGAACSP